MISVYHDRYATADSRMITALNSEVHLSRVTIEVSTLRKVSTKPQTSLRNTRAFGDGGSCQNALTAGISIDDREYLMLEMEVD